MATTAPAPAVPVASATAQAAEGASRGHPSKKASKASAKGLKASRQTTLASREAGFKSQEEAGTAKSGAPEATPNAQTPVVTLADAPSATTPGDSGRALVDSPAPVLGATGASSGDDIHLQADRMIHEVSDESRKIDSKNLDGDEKRRQTIALQLLKSAEKAYTDQDYSAAYSLAVKASILLKPLPQTTSSRSP